MLKRLHAGAAWLFVAAIVVQVFLIGTALRELGGSDNFNDHINFGYTYVGFAALLVVVTALIARAGRRSIGISVGLLLLYVVQTMLPYAKDSIPWISALHPVNAMLMFALSIWFAWGAWKASIKSPAA
jgi:putative tricarboxylic transport membrane protein